MIFTLPASNVLSVHPGFSLKPLLAQVGKEAKAESSFDYAAAVEKRMWEVQGATAVITISGVIMEDDPCWCYWFRMTAPSAVSRLIKRAVADENIENIIFVFNSPGGCVVGVPELAAEIRACPKPKSAYVDGMCASAAYWLASQCSPIVSTRGAVVGSIGVYTILYETADLANAFGIKTHLISSGSLKAIGEFGTVFTEEQQDFMQGRINALFDMFRGDILAVRPSITDESMNGGYWFGQEALDRHLIDGILLPASAGD